MSLAARLTLPDRAGRRLARLTPAIRRLVPGQLSAMMDSLAPLDQVQTAAAILRRGWANDPNLRERINPQVLKAQEEVSQLVLEDEDFRAQLDAVKPGWSEDALAIALHGVADALVYDKHDDTASAIATLYGPIEQFYPWDEMGSAKPPAWFSPPAV
jgi:hypothetical protein